MADATKTFRAVITAVDNATSVLERIGSKIKGIGKSAEAAGNPWGQAAERVSLFRRATDLAHRSAAGFHSIAAPFEHLKHPIGEVRHGVGELKEHFGELGEKITELMPPLAALGAGGSLAGLFELTHKVAETAGELGRAAIKMGMTTDAVVALNYAARMTETPIDSMQKGMGKLGRVIGESAAGKDKDAAALFSHLHISLREANGQLLKATDALPKLQEAFGRTTDVTMRQRMAFALFGRAGLEMLPMLMASTDDMDKWGKTAAKLSYPFSETDLSNLEEFQHSWIGLETATNGVVNAIGARLAPILTPVVEKVTEWISANREWIATGIGDKVGQLADWVMKLDFDKVVAGTKAWLEPLGWAAEKIGGVKGVIFGTAAAMAVPWVASAAIMVKTLGEIGAAAIGASWKIGGALVASIRAAETAMSNFNAVAARNPFIRAAMIGATLYDWGTNTRYQATQQELDHADPDKVKAEGFTRNGSGKWVYNGYEARDEDAAPGPLRQPDFLGRLFRGIFGGDHGDGSGDGAPANQTDPLRQLGAAVNPGGRQGKVDIGITFTNAPPGLGVTGRSSGFAAVPDIDVGYAFPGMGLAY